jgi:hypothetical protein
LHVNNNIPNRQREEQRVNAIDVNILKDSNFTPKRELYTVKKMREDLKEKKLVISSNDSSKDDTNETETSLFSLLNKNVDLKPNIMNYFNYKLFDSKGESLEANKFIDYSDSKVELFKADPADKERYDHPSRDSSVRILESEDDKKSISKNHFGPQKSNFVTYLLGHGVKAAVRDRNFKPY